MLTPGLLFLTNWIFLSGRSSHTMALLSWQEVSCQAPSITAMQGSSPSPPVGVNPSGWGTPLLPVTAHLFTPITCKYHRPHFNYSPVPRTYPHTIRVQTNRAVSWQHFYQCWGPKPAINVKGLVVWCVASIHLFNAKYNLLPNIMWFDEW